MMEFNKDFWTTELLSRFTEELNTHKLYLFIDKIVINKIKVRRVIHGEPTLNQIYEYAPFKKDSNYYRLIAQVNFASFRSRKQDDRNAWHNSLCQNADYSEGQVKNDLWKSTLG